MPALFLSHENKRERRKIGLRLLSPPLLRQHYRVYTGAWKSNSLKLNDSDMSDVRDTQGACGN